MNWLGADWQNLAAWLDDEIAGKRAKLENPKTTWEETLVLRGELKALKNLAAQADLDRHAPRTVEDAAE